MATKQQLVKRCKELGAMLLDGGDCVRVDAPVGKVIAGPEIHSLDIYTHGWNRADVYDSLLIDLAEGLAECENPNCDSCIREPMTFEQIAELYRGERLA